MRPYEKLIAWQEAYALCLMIYRITKTFPADERFGLTSQIRRAASSVPINIAEGNVKRSSKEKIQFFRIAQGSLEETHCESRLAKDVGYLKEEDFLSIDQQIHKTSYLLTQLTDSFEKE
jgi:four helix bundle protein